MEAEKKKLKFSKTQALVLASLIGLILLLPILISKLAVKMWHELLWDNPTDLSMLVWTGAFLEIFLFLLLIEHFRQTKKLVFIPMGCGFLAMGILDFFYALSPLGTDLSIWLKIFSMFLGGLSFALCIPARDKEEEDLPRVLIRYVFPTVLISVFLGFLPQMIKAVLPQLLSLDTSQITTIGELVLLFCGALFFGAAVLWLNRYMTDGFKREDLVFSISILLLAQTAVIMRYSQVWGAIWWGWHFIIVIDLFIASIYLLALCVNRSLIWRLLLSLGLAFGLTVIISSSLIQSHSEKNFEENLKKQFHCIHRQQLFKNSAAFLFSKSLLMNLESSEKLKGAIPDDIFKVISGNNWNKLLLDYGVVLKDGTVLSSSEKIYGISPSPVAINAAINNKDKPHPSETIWTDFYHDNSLLVTTGTRPLINKDKQLVGYAYCTVDVSQLCRQSIFRTKISIGEERLFVNKNNEILYRSKIIEDKDLIKKITVESVGLGEEGKVWSTLINGVNYLIIADIMPETDWAMVDIINMDYLPPSKSRVSRFIFASSAMASLLLGFIVLLLLLNYQIARPIKKIINATKALDDGDFDVQIKTDDPNELGQVSRSFDEMVVDLKKLYWNLNETVKDRTAALQLAQKAHQAQQIFYANTTQGLRTPLHAILSFSKFGMDKKRIDNPEKALEYFQLINESGQRLLEIIDEILDSSKIESGFMELEYSTANIFLIALQVYEELKPTFQKKNISFKCEKPDFETSLIIDREKIFRVIRNIVGNALKFSDSDTEIEIVFREFDDSIAMSILDQGLGLPGDKLEEIFEKYYQVNAGVPHGSGTGTGLGLSVCREIIALHKGTIKAANRPDGKGAEFTFTLPRPKNNFITA